MWSRGTDEGLDALRVVGREGGTYSAAVCRDIAAGSCAGRVLCDQGAGTGLEGGVVDLQRRDGVTEADLVHDDPFCVCVTSQQKMG